MKALLSVVAVSCFLAACSSTTPKKTTYADLKVGMIRQEAAQIAGVPAFDSRRGSGEAWFYEREEKWKSDWLLTREDCVPVVLRGDRVVGWGERVRGDAGLIAYGDKPPLKFGMGKKDIRRFIGNPLFADQLGNREVLYYPLTRSGEPPAELVREKLYPIVLVDGGLTRWGANAKEDAAKISARDER